MVKGWTIKMAGSDEIITAVDFNEAYTTAIAMRDYNHTLTVDDDRHTIDVGSCRHIGKLRPVYDQIRSLVDGSYGQEIVGYECPNCGELVANMNGGK